jgi:hypothetical protein
MREQCVVELVLPVVEPVPSTLEIHMEEPLDDAGVEEECLGDSEHPELVEEDEDVDVDALMDSSGHSSMPEKAMNYRIDLLVLLVSDRLIPVEVVLGDPHEDIYQLHSLEVPGAPRLNDLESAVESIHVLIEEACKDAVKAICPTIQLILIQSTNEVVIEAPVVLALMNGLLGETDFAAKVDDNPA